LRSLSNLDGQPRSVVYFESIIWLRCTEASSRLTVPAHSVILLPVTKTARPYMIFTKPERVLVNAYHRMEGTTSTFNVDSGITFGAPVEKKQ
jgi:hypothetical protein